MPRKNKGAEQQGKASDPMMKYAIWILYGLIAVSILAYSIYNNAIIGAVALLLIIVTLIAEFRTSIKEEGAKKSVYEVVIVLVVVFVAWFIVGKLLQTSSPINVVASCSMLPTLHRGDMVFLHGITNMSQFLSNEHIPVVKLTGSQFTSVSNISKTWRIYLPYYNNDTSSLRALSSPNPYAAFIPQGSNYKVGLYDWNCLRYYVENNDPSKFSKCFISPSEQRSSLVQYNYSIEKLQSSNGTMSSIIVTSAVKIANTTIVENYTEPIIVYATVSNDSYPPSDIVHRLVAAVKDDGSYYLLTKGDNNPYLDLQALNYPIGQNSTIGYVIGSVPVLGYMKIILSGQLASVEGCNETTIR